MRRSVCAQQSAHHRYWVGCRWWKPWPSIRYCARPRIRARCGTGRQRNGSVADETALLLWRVAPGAVVRRCVRREDVGIGECGRPPGCRSSLRWAQLRRQPSVVLIRGLSREYHLTVHYACYAVVSLYLHRKSAWSWGWKYPEVEWPIQRPVPPKKFFNKNLLTIVH